MNTDRTAPTTRFRGLHAELSDAVIRTFYDVYNELGSGFLESVYHKAFAMALRHEELSVETELAVPVYFRGSLVGDFRADLAIDHRILIELKALSALDKTHEGQLLNYLRATRFEVGLLFNFGPRPQFRRLVLDNERKQIRVNPCSSVVGFGGGR